MPALVPRLTDGLGNRLFQYSVAKALSEKWGWSLVFAKRYTHATNHGNHELFFKLFPEVPFDNTEQDYTILANNKDAIFVYKELTMPSRSAILTSCWHNPRYFADTLIEPNWANALGALTEISVPSNTWMVHFRRGDYDILNHYDVDLSKYYRKCFLAIPGGANVRIFSDEPLKCHDQLESALDGRLDLSISWSKETQDCRTLYEMSLCSGGAITANSTFSWWGAYFAKQRAGAGFQAFYPHSWGVGLPPPNGVVPSWGEMVHVT